MGMMPYNQKFRLHRKLTATQVSQRAIVRFQPIQELEVLQFLKRMFANYDGNSLQHSLNQSVKTFLEQPQNDNLIITPRISGSIMLRILYNYKTDPGKNDPLVANSNLVMEEFSQATSPGSWMVDLIPWLKHVPEWVPGAGFQTTAKLWKDHLMHSVEDPYEYAKEQMAKGNDKVSYVAGLIKDVHRQIDSEERNVISWSAASMFNAGTDTTSVTLFAFFMAMVLFPGVQQRAQDEIDTVVGDSRLPSFSDKVNLPYVQAVVQETLRWHTLAPMGFPHLTTEDDHYNGYFIPRNALILPAVAWLAHDPAVYHSPAEFKPERFLEPYNEPPVSEIAFGFGRRACPGRHIAEQTMFLCIAQTLAVFSIRKTENEQGKHIVQYEMLPGVISRVKPLPHRIIPRSEKHRRFIEQSL